MSRLGANIKSLPMHQVGYWPVRMKSWPPEDRPSYALTELETLSAIPIDELARQLGKKRSATYTAVKTGLIPRIKINKRYCVPEDVVQRLHERAYKHSLGLEHVGLLVWSGEGASNEIPTARESSAEATSSALGLSTQEGMLKQ